jgi:transcriptional regulator with XRE-family HTH domain
MPRTAAKAFSPDVEQAATRLGARLRATRIACRLSREELSQRTGLSQWTIEAIERGSPATTLGAYLEAMRVYEALQQVDDLAQGAPPGLPTRMRRGRHDRVDQAIARTHERLLQEVADGERDARSLMLIPDSIAKAPAVFPQDAFGPPEEW